MYEETLADLLACATPGLLSGPQSCESPGPIPGRSYGLWPRLQHVFRIVCLQALINMKIRLAPAVAVLAVLLATLLSLGKCSAGELVATSSSPSNWFDLATWGRYLCGVVSFVANHPMYMALRAWFNDILGVIVTSSPLAQWATPAHFPLVFMSMVLALVIVQGLLVVQLMSTRKLRARLQHLEQQKHVELQRLSARVQELRGQLQAAQQAVAATEQAAAEARAAERHATARATAAAGMAAFCSTVTGLAPPPSAALQPLAALSASQPSLQAMRARDHVALANTLTDEQAMDISNIPSVNYINNPTVTGQASNLMSARKHSIAAAIILLTSMTVQQAATVTMFLSGDMVKGGFGASCSRMKRKQAECDEILNPIFEGVFGNANEYNGRRNAAFLIVSTLLQNGF